MLASQQIRQNIRQGIFSEPTAGAAPGFVQANLVVLPKSLAADFLLFCQRNPKPCPLLSVSDPALQLIWQQACEALINHQIKEIELIDFPEGQERSQTITIEQLPKKGFALWKKPVVGSLQDMLRR